MGKAYLGDYKHYERLILEGFNVSINDYVIRGWEIFAKGAVYFVPYSFLVLFLQFVLAQLPIFSILSTFILWPFFKAGYYLVAHKYSLGEEVLFSDFFKADKDLFQLLLANLVETIFVFIPSAFLGFFMAIFSPMSYLVIPIASIVLVIVLVVYHFSTPFILFGNLTFWDAMEASSLLISRRWFSFVFLGIVAGSIIVLGICALGVGLLVAFPLVWCISYAAFEDILIRELGDTGLYDLIDQIGSKDREVG